MDRSRSLLVASILLAAILPAAGASAPIQVTYLGNEGFLIEGSGKKVLIDALQGNGLPGYVALPGENREKLETAASPFDGVDLVLATHYHADHFDATAVGRHLQSNTDAVFVSTEQAVDQLRGTVASFDRLKSRVKGVAPREGERLRMEIAGIPLQVLNLHHGRNRPVQNLGFVVELSGMRLLHIGDTQATAEEFRLYELTKDRLDLAFVPAWYLLSRTWDGVAGELGADQVLAMHLPAADAPPSYFGRMGGLERTYEFLEQSRPKTIWFTTPMEQRTFDTKRKQPERAPNPFRLIMQNSPPKPARAI